MTKGKQPKVELTDEGKRKAEEVAKTTRLRTLRLAKEAADRAAAKR
jgi:Mn-dependent DtxR family transcriptional regulator